MDCARLVNNDGLPPHVLVPTIGLASIFGIMALIATLGVPHAHLLRSGLAAAIGTSPSSSMCAFAYGEGMYNTRSFTVARVIGGVALRWWLRRCDGRGEDKKILIVIIASGFVLGEGVCSIISLGLAATGV